MSRFINRKSKASSSEVQGFFFGIPRLFSANRVFFLVMSRPAYRHVNACSLVCQVFFISLQSLAHRFAGISTLVFSVCQGLHIVCQCFLIGMLRLLHMYARTSFSVNQGSPRSNLGNGKASFLVNQGLLIDLPRLRYRHVKICSLVCLGLLVSMPRLLHRYAKACASIC